MGVQNPVETIIGAGVLALAVGFAAYAANSAGASATGGYELTASFRAANGVGPGTDIRIAGVKVGSVAAVSLEPETFRARVVLAIRDDITIAEDSLVKIDSEGLLGGSFIALEPGASLDNLDPGDEIEYTQGSVSLLDLVSKFGGGGSDTQGTN